MTTATSTIKFEKRNDEFHGTYYYWTDDPECRRGHERQWLRITRTDAGYRERHGLPAWAKWMLNGYTSQLTQLDPQCFETKREAIRWASRLV